MSNSNNNQHQDGKHKDSLQQQHNDDSQKIKNDDDSHSGERMFDLSKHISLMKDNAHKQMRDFILSVKKDPDFLLVKHNNTEHNDECDEHSSEDFVLISEHSLDLNDPMILTHPDYYSNQRFGIKLDSSEKGGDKKTILNSSSDTNSFTKSTTTPSTSSLKYIMNAKKSNEIMISSSLLNNLRVMERAVEQNCFYQTQFQFRGCFGEQQQQEQELVGENPNVLSLTNPDSVSDNETSCSPSVEKEMTKLFQFQCDLTVSRPVNCLCWHKGYRDILIAGYGSTSNNSTTNNTVKHKSSSDLNTSTFDETTNNNNKEDGLILFWSLRNLSYPEEVLYIEGGAVTSIDVSKTDPSIMAVGMSNGNLAIYDTSLRRNRGLANKNAISHSSLTLTDSSSSSAVASCSSSPYSLYSSSTISHIPIAESQFVKGRHMVPILQVSWVNHHIDNINRHNDKGRGCTQTASSTRSTLLSSSSSSSSSDDKRERLITTGSDGKILEWHIQKGLKCTSLMLLKRIVQTPKNAPINTSVVEESENKKEQQLQNGAASVLSRYASSLCFDFPKAIVPKLKSKPPNDKSSSLLALSSSSASGYDDITCSNPSLIYLVGADDGVIYRCSSSYNEQHLDATKEHDGPVTHIRCSPFLPNIFLSCSNDWTAKLWRIGNSSDTSSSSTTTTTITSPDVSTATDTRNSTMQPLLEFHSMNLFDCVNDIAWSPFSSTMFSLVTGDGRLELWDLSKSSHNLQDPIAIDYGTDQGEQFKRLCVLFSDFNVDFDDECIMGNNIGVPTQETQQQININPHKWNRNPILVSGSNNGTVEVFQIGNYSYSNHGNHNKNSSSSSLSGYVQNTLTWRRKEIEKLNKAIS